MSTKIKKDAWLLGTEEVQAQSAPKKSFNISLTKPKMKLKDVAWVMDKLATTQNAGVPLYRALGMLSEMREGDPVSLVLDDIEAQMTQGKSFEASLRTHEKSFGPLVCSLIEAGAESGKLERSLRRAAELTDSKVRLRRKIKGAMIYPISVLVITTSLVAALLLFVVPRFEDIYSSVGSDLPAMTKFLVLLSNYAPLASLFVLALILIFYLIVRHSKKDENLRRKLDVIKMRIPVVGSLLRKGANARIASTLSSLLGSGVPLLQALEHAAAAADNVVYSDALKAVRQRIGDGMLLSASLRAAGKGVFPPLFIQLAEVGETAGDLPELMDKYAKDSEEEVANTADALTRIIEPLMMIVIGGVVGVFLIGMYLPIIQIGDQIQ